MAKKKHRSQSAPASKDIAVKGWSNPKTIKLESIPPKVASILLTNALLKEGRIKIGSYSDDGKEIIKAIFYPGEVFGELSIIWEGKRKDFAQALDSNVRIYAINKKQIERLLGSVPHLNFEITKIIGGKLQKVERRLESLVFKDARQRIIDFVKNSAIEKGRKVGYGFVLKHELTHQDMANLTANSRQTVTIVFNELKEEGIINFDRKSIFIHDIKDI